MHWSAVVLLLALVASMSRLHAGEAESVIPEPRSFVELATQIALIEIEAARVALDRSRDPAIRDFAQRRMRDLDRDHAELAALAANEGVAAPTQLDADHQALLDALTSRTGAEFGRDYSRHLRQGHAKAVALFEAASNSPDPEVSGFAAKALPTWRAQQALAGKLPGAARGDPGSGAH